MVRYGMCSLKNVDLMRESKEDGGLRGLCIHNLPDHNKVAVERQTVNLGKYWRID